MTDLNITLEEENLEQIQEEVKGYEMDQTTPNKEEENTEDMDTHGDILLKYECDIWKKKVMTKKGLKIHKNRMHEKSLQWLERERKQQFSCDECDIKRNTEILLKNHKKLVHDNIKKNLSEMRRGLKTISSPTSPSPPTKKEKENSISLEKEDLERKKSLRRPRPKNQEPVLHDKNQKEIVNLKNILTASGEVIANVKDENTI